MAKSTIYSGGGRLYYKRYNPDTQEYDPIIYFGATDGITLNTNIEWKTHENTEGCEALTDARLPASKETNISFTTSEITLTMLNRAMLGEIVEISQPAETDKSISVDGTMVKQGHIVDLGVVNATGCTVNTYVEGTDYEFESKSGYLTIIDGGGIADGTALTVVLADVPAVTRKISAAMKQSSLLGEFIVITSSQTANNYKYTFKNVSVTLSGDFQVKGQEIGTLSFEGSVMINTSTIGSGGTLSDYVDIEELETDAC